MTASGGADRLRSTSLRRPRAFLLAAGAGLALLATAALAPADIVRGTPGPDQLVGTPENDRLNGRGGNDRVSGEDGADLVRGASGEDVLRGGPGPDVLRGGGGEDGIDTRGGVQLSSPGDDEIRARDGYRDTINCGAGNDVAFVDDVEDGVYDCERVLEP